MQEEMRRAILESGCSTIGIANQKGGVGKSTTTIHLYQWLRRLSFNPLIIDGDRQQSSTAWATRAGFDVELMTKPDDLYRQIVTAKRAHDLVLIDAPGSLADPTLAVFEEADLVLIPIQPTLTDIEATAETIAKLERVQRQRRGKPETLCFVSLARPNQRAIGEMREAFTQLYPQVSMMESIVYKLDCIPESSKYGLTVWEAEQYLSSKKEVAVAHKAAETYQQLFMEAIQWQKSSVLV